MHTLASSLAPILYPRSNLRRAIRPPRPLGPRIPQQSHRLPCAGEAGTPSRLLANEILHLRSNAPRSQIGGEIDVAVEASHARLQVVGLVVVEDVPAVVVVLAGLELLAEVGEEGDELTFQA